MCLTGRAPAYMSRHRPCKHIRQHGVHRRKRGWGSTLGQVPLVSHPMSSAGPARRFSWEYLAFFPGPQGQLLRLPVCLPYPIPFYQASCPGSAASQAVQPALKSMSSQTDFLLPKDLRNMNGSNEKLHTYNLTSLDHFSEHFLQSKQDTHRSPGAERCTKGQASTQP